jgi:hypothetical protein
MALYQIGETNITPVPDVTFGSAGVYERRDLQRFLRENVAILSPDTFVLAEEFGEWEDSKRRIDLLGLDTDANLVVIELKRTETGGHMELQAVRYAAMVAKMTFAQAVDAHRRYLETIGQNGEEAESAILSFLGWDEPSEELFATDVRIVLASAEFSRELATAVLWLNEHGLDVRCVRMRPYQLDNRVLLDVQQVLPLPEAEDYQIKIREKVTQTRERRESSRDFTRFDLTMDGESTSGLAKRRMLLIVVQHIVQRYGLSPEDVQAILPRHKYFWFATVDGDVNEDQFITAVSAKFELVGRTFDPRRYFTDDAELIRVGGKTYALTNQVSGGLWRRAIDSVREKVPGISIEYSPTQSA